MSTVIPCVVGAPLGLRLDQLQYRDLSVMTLSGSVLKGPEEFTTVNCPTVMLRKEISLLIYLDQLIQYSPILTWSLRESLRKVAISATEPPFRQATEPPFRQATKPQIKVPVAMNVSMPTTIPTGGNRIIVPTFLPFRAFRLRRRQEPRPATSPCRVPKATAATHHFLNNPHGAPPGHPLSSLEEGQWFKLICGASSHDVPAIKNLSSVYTAAGADCIDVACDMATVAAAREGIEEGLRHRRSSYKPILMVSVNAGEDPHFRKAQFDVSGCPAECSRPCEHICPAFAINQLGVIRDVCYGCGRCVPICPPGIIETVDYRHDVSTICGVLEVVDALEIHTGPQRREAFQQLWTGVREAAARLKVVAVSLPDLGGDAALEEGITGIWDILNQGVVVGENSVRLIWQADGRPMSGDIGRGTAHAAVRLGKRIRDILTSRRIPGEVQLAGGTNDATVPLLRKSGMLHGARGQRIAGVAMGGFARKVIREVLVAHGGYDTPMSDKGFEKAVEVARALVYDIKNPSSRQPPPASTIIYNQRRDP